MIKKLAVLFAVLAVFAFPMTAFAETREVWLVPGDVSDESGYVYLNPGNTLKLSVLNYGYRTVYYKVVSSGGTILRHGYVDGGEGIEALKIGGGVGNWKLYLKCTTGSTVYTDCDVHGVLWD